MVNDFVDLICGYYTLNAPFFSFSFRLCSGSITHTHHLLHQSLLSISLYISTPVILLVYLHMTVDVMTYEHWTQHTFALVDSSARAVPACYLMFVMVTRLRPSHLDIFSRQAL